MIGCIQEFLRKRKYGEAIILVSGLPRSGTSMMMKMLEAAELEIVTDNIRTADDDNPKGYFEFEKVKELDKGGDKSWVRDLRGKVVKIISFLLTDLPEDNYYRIIFMRRDLDEVLASQNKMLVHRGEDQKTEDERMKENYAKHLRKIEVFVFDKPNVEVLEVDHRDTIKDPEGTARRIRKFLGRPLPIEKMAQVVDPNLYRNRAEAAGGK